MLRGMLLDFCVTWGRVDHDAHHHRERTTTMGCSFAPGALIEAHWLDRRLGPRRSLGQWAAAYTQAFQATHATYGAYELRRMIDNGFRHSLSLRRCASELGMSMRRLQVDFKRLTGSSPQDYLGARRARAAVRMLQDTDEKVEWIAREVGWSSRKNLNQALARHVGLSPAGIRSRCSLSRVLDPPSDALGT